MLAEVLLDELIRAAGLPPIPGVRAAFRLAFGRVIRRCSRLILELDGKVARSGFAAAARWLLPTFVAGYEANRVESFPASGPLLIVSNHPGVYDAVVISAFVGRTDYKLIIADLPAYRFLPNVSAHAIFSPQSGGPHGRMQTLRRAIRHLRSGGALLIFPRGRVEPDPACMLDATEELDLWSRSLEIMLDQVPGVRVLVAIVSGVISPAVMRHPIAWLRATSLDRQRLASIYQVFQQVSSGRELFGLSPRVTFGELLTGDGTQVRLADIRSSARRTLELHMAKTILQPRDALVG